MKKIIIFLLFIFTVSSFKLYSQTDEKIVEVEGNGISVDDAKRDAYKNAVEAACGVTVFSKVSSEFRQLTENTLKTRAQGYIKSSEMIGKPVTKGNLTTVKIKATVSLKEVEMDSRTLAQWLGGLRFLVVYDEREFEKDELKYFDYAYERMNEYLADHKYRYIEKKVFDKLRNEALVVSESDPDKMSPTQILGYFLDAEFAIEIKKIHFREAQTAVGISSCCEIEGKVYDNCTAEGLGTVTLKIDDDASCTISKDKETARRNAIAETVSKGSDRLMYLVSDYLGEWINNGAPFEVRFYGIDSYKSGRRIRQKIEESGDFGGQLEDNYVKAYYKIMCTYKNSTSKFTDKVIDITESVPDFSKMDVRIKFGRQVSLAFPDTKIPIEDKKRAIAIE